MVNFLFENSLDIFLLVFYKHFGRTKVLSFNLGSFDRKTSKITMT